MNRLVKYFVISMMCNIAILVFLFLPHKDSGTKPVNGGKPEKGFSMLPVGILPDLDDKNINEALNNRKYRPVEITEDNKKSVKNKQDEKPNKDK